MFMAASQIRADLFSEFISRSSRDNGGDSLRAPAKSDTDNTTSDRRVQAESAEPSTAVGAQTNSTEHSQIHTPEPKHEQPWLLLLQLLAEHEGKMCIKSLLDAKGNSTIGNSKIDTLRQLDQLEKMEFVEVTSKSDLDMVKLTTLGRWAAKYVH